MKSSLPVDRSSAQAVLQMLEQWLELTELESDALQRADWTGVRSAQAKKGELMDRCRFPDAGTESLTGGFKSQIQHLAGQIQTQERANQTLLAARLDCSRRELASLGTSARNLKQLHGAYQSSSRAGWQWYS
jgi:hypothetical protein